MIAQLRGQVVSKNDKALTLLVGGVGYQIYTLADALTKIKLEENLTLHTHLAVRDDALDLYGFETKVALDYFHLLLGVPGIGPKSALAILNLAAPEVLERAITAADTAYLTRVSGISQKNAEKIIMTLKDKLPPPTGITTTDTGNLLAEAEALEALKALGYSGHEARDALKKVDRSVSTGAMIKLALKTLSGQTK